MKKCKYQNCKNPRFSKNDNFCIFHSTNAKSHNFKNKLLELIADKDSSGLIFLDGYNFPANFSLKDISISKSIFFVNCRFHGDIEIMNSSFKSLLRFENCEFSNNFSIGQNKIESFSMVKCQVLENFAFFVNTTNSLTSVRNTQINGYCIFSFCLLQGQFEIVQTKVADAWYFYGIDFSAPARTRFKDLDLTNVYFSDSRLVNIDFFGIKWNEKKHRILIGDEQVIRNSTIPPHYPILDVDQLRGHEVDVETLYLQLCSNFEKNRLFFAAGKFYISSMEMKRLAKKSWLSRNIFSWEVWYKIISYYGESSAQAFGGIILLFLLSSILISLNLKSSLSLGESEMAAFKYFNLLFESIKYNFFLLLHPAGWSIKEGFSFILFITSLERFLIIFLGTFFLLALKRRFRRS